MSNQENSIIDVGNLNSEEQIAASVLALFNVLVDKKLITAQEYADAYVNQIEEMKNSK